MWDKLAWVTEPWYFLIDTTAPLNLPTSFIAVYARTKMPPLVPWTN